MWTRRLGFVVFLLVAGVIFLTLPQPGTEMHVSAEAPAYKPSSSQFVFLPFISYHDPLSRSPLWRFGIDRVLQPFSAYDSIAVAHMRLSWYIDFGVDVNPPTYNGMEYMPMVRMHQWKVMPDGTPTLCCVGCSYKVPASYSISPPTSTIQSIAASHHGLTWIVGNEMERIDWGTGACNSQDEMVPEVYAQAYHEVYSALKSADSTAQVSMGALVQPSPLRIKWLDRVWAEYTRRYTVTMPVDLWNIHVYVYNEQKGQYGADIPAGLTETVGSVYQIRDNKDFTKAAAMIVGWRTWMKAHGQQNKPLITPEYGVVYPDWLEDPPGTVTFSPSQIRDSYMYPSFNYYLNHTDPSIGYPPDGNRLVQRWAWWSMDYDDGSCWAPDLSKPNSLIFSIFNNGALFYSGLGPSAPPRNCAYPAKGLTQLGSYWTSYVQGLPPGSAPPYAPVRSPVAASQPAALSATVSAAPESAMLKYASESGLCSDSSEVRTQFLQSLPSRSTPEGEQAWLMALSKLTPGTRICMP